MHTNIWKQWKFLLNLLLLTLIPMQSRREICCKIMSVNSNNYLMTRGYPNCSALRWFEDCRKRTIEEGLNEMKNLCREYTLPRNEKASRARGWIIGSTKIGNSFMGSNRERNRQVCNRNVRNHFPWECGAQSCRETCCQSETNYWSLPWHCLPFLSLCVEGNG